MATNQRVMGGQAIGFIPSVPVNAAGTLPLSGATGGTGWASTYSQTGLGLGFVAAANKQITAIRAYLSAVNGTLASGDLVCDIFSDVGGVPTTSQASSTTITGSVPTTAQWVEWTGFTFNTAATETQYWAVLRNNNQTSVTANFPTYKFGAAGSLPNPTLGNQVRWGWGKVHTVNGGAAFGSTPFGAGAFLRIAYSDGSYQGCPIQNLGTGTDKVYGSHEAGVRFTTPSNGSLNVRGIAMMVVPGGVPTGTLCFKIYNINTGLVIGTTDNIPVANAKAGGGGWLFAYLPATITIAGGIPLRVTAKNNAADSTSNNYVMYNDYTVDSDSNSLPLMPFGGTLQHTAFDGSTWTDTNTIINPVALLLDTDGEFPSGGGGVSGIIGG